VVAIFGVAIVEAKKSLVVLINDLRVTGGAERLVVDFANGAVNQFSITICVIGSDLARQRELCEGIKVVSLKLDGIRKFVSELLYADIKYVHLFPCLYIAAFLPGKKIFHEHNTSNRRRSKKWLRVFESFVYRRYSAIICISGAVKLSLERWIGGAGKLTVVDNFSVMPAVGGAARLAKFHSTSKNNIRIGMAGSFSAQKDQRFLIDIFNCEDSIYQLHLIGDGCPFDSEKFPNVVVWTDSSKIEEFYETIDIYVHAAHWEGFGLVVLEAMRKSLPVLVPDIPGVREVVGVPEFLYEQYSREDLLTKLNLIADDYEASVSNSIERAKYYSFDRFFSAFSALLED